MNKKKKHLNNSNILILRKSSKHTGTHLYPSEVNNLNCNATEPARDFVKSVLS